MVKQLKQGKIYSANLLQFNSLYSWFSKIFSTLLSHTQTCFRRANLTNLVHTQEGFAGISKILVAFALYHDAGLGNPQILILEILILETSKIKFSKTIKIKNGMSVPRSTRGSLFQKFYFRSSKLEPFKANVIYDVDATKG